MDGYADYVVKEKNHTRYNVCSYVPASTNSPPEPVLNHTDLLPDIPT